MSDKIEIPEAYKNEAGLKTLALHLRSQNGIKVRSGIEHDKRVDYFKGICNIIFYIDYIRYLLFFCIFYLYNRKKICRSYFATKKVAFKYSSSK